MVSTYLFPDGVSPYVVNSIVHGQSKCACTLPYRWFSDVSDVPVYFTCQNYNQRFFRNKYTAYSAARTVFNLQRRFLCGVMPLFTSNSSRKRALLLYILLIKQIATGPRDVSQRNQGKLRYNHVVFRQNLAVGLGIRLHSWRHYRDIGELTAPKPATLTMIRTFSNMLSSAHYEFMLINKFEMFIFRKLDNLRFFLLYKIKGLLLPCTSEDIWGHFYVII